MVSGLTLDTSEKQLALLYLATVQGIAYGTRHIVDHCNSHGHKVRIHPFILYTSIHMISLEVPYIICQKQLSNTFMHMYYKMVYLSLSSLVECLLVFC